MSKQDAAVLKTPCALPAETLPNRLAKAAMTEGLADAAGRPTEGHQKLYAAWGRGGAGLLITGNVIIDRDQKRSAFSLLQVPVGIGLRWTPCCHLLGRIIANPDLTDRGMKYRRKRFSVGGFKLTDQHPSNAMTASGNWK